MYYYRSPYLGGPYPVQDQRLWVWPLAIGGIGFLGGLIGGGLAGGFVASRPFYGGYGYPPMGYPAMGYPPVAINQWAIQNPQMGTPGYY